MHIPQIKMCIYFKSYTMDFYKIAFVQIAIYCL